METIFNVVLPVFALIFSGWLAARIGILSGESTDALNKFVFFIAMPVLLFNVVATLDPKDVFNWTFIIAFLGANIIVLIVAILFSMIFFKRDLADASLFAMGSVFGNSVYMGIPLSMIAYGNPGLSPAIIASVFQGIALIIPVVILIELGVNKSSEGAGTAIKLARSLLRNPLMIGPIVGFAWSLTGWDLPLPVATFSEILGGAAGPCALFAIGLFLYRKPLSEGVGEVGTLVILKLLIQPIIAWVLLFHVFTVDPAFAKVGVLLSALPTGANCFVIAQQYGRFVQRTSAAILISTIVAVVTLSVILNLPIMASFKGQVLYIF